MTCRQSLSARVGELGVNERHYSIRELADLWSLSEDSVRRLFQNVSGVLVFRRYRPGRRTYRTIRIPESVAHRVYEEMKVA